MNSTFRSRRDLAHAGQVAGRRDADARLALDRLEQHGDGVVGDRGAQGVEVAVRDGDEAGRERAVVVAGLRVVGEADDRRGAAVEVAAGHDDLRPAGGHALDPVAPLAGDLDARLHGLGAGVHGQDHLLAHQRRERGGEGGELVVVEGARGQGDALELGAGGVEQARVAVAEVRRRVRREEVEVVRRRRRRSPRRPRRGRPRPRAGGSCARRARPPARAGGGAVEAGGRGRVEDGGHRGSPSEGVGAGVGRISWVQHLTLPPPRSSSEVSISTQT